MKFLNCLLNTCPNLNTRVYLQHELETAGLDVNLMEEVRFSLIKQMVQLLYMSRIVRKPDFCLGENKGADQLRGYREADQRLCFRYSDSTIPLLLKSEISSF